MRHSLLLYAVALAVGGCGGGATTTNIPEPTLRSAVPPITSAGQAESGVVIPGHLDCRAPNPGDAPGQSANGQVCTQVAIAGCTEPGKYFPDYGACDIVRSQRPYWPAKPAGTTDAADPRLNDTHFMAELGWVTSQVRAAACSCCHDGSQAPMGASQWDIKASGIWTDSASDSAIALFAGFADSSLFGAYPPAENNGFERDLTGLPSTDGPRMRAFFVDELTRRGITEAEARAVPPFGGPFYTNQHIKPKACTGGEGVDGSGKVTWAGGPARYIYILDSSADNPGAPPNMDLPSGTIWRLDVLASADAVTEARYGITPAGTVQSFPGNGRAPQLEKGKTYHIYVLRDIAVPSTNCLFTYGG